MLPSNTFQSNPPQSTKEKSPREETDHEPPPPRIVDIEACIEEVENILSYQFRDRTLLIDALTHSSFTGSPSYQRIAFVGDAVLGLAMANFFYVSYPKHKVGDLSLIRSANVNTEKLARVAVHHGLYRYIRHNAPDLAEQVKEFVAFVENEHEASVYVGELKAPKVLADIVEAITAAIYFDLDFDLKALWRVIEMLWQPMVTLEKLHTQPQPVTFLCELCQKQGRRVKFEYSKEGSRNIFGILVDGELVASDSSPLKEIAKLNAAREALRYLSQSNMINKEMTDISCKINKNNEVVAAKQELNKICSRLKWLKPTYKIEKEEGPAHAKSYMCSVCIDTPEGELFKMGEARTRQRAAENSAASLMICSLIQSKNEIKSMCARMSFKSMSES